LYTTLWDYTLSRIGLGVDLPSGSHGSAALALSQFAVTAGRREKHEGLKRREEWKEMTTSKEELDPGTSLRDAALAA
jgi:hypothetical protein